MYAAVFRAFRSAQRPVVLRSACRTVGGARHPVPRNFHRSAISHQAPQEPPPTSGDKEEASTETPPPESEDGKVEDGVEVPEKVEEAAPDKTTDTEVSTPRRNGKSTGRTRGVPRIKQPEGVPPAVLPDWFWSTNVKCRGDSALTETLVFETGQLVSNSEAIALEGPQESLSRKYVVNGPVYHEIYSTIRAGLAINSPRNVSNKPINRPISLLYCPRNNATAFLDTIVEHVASDLDADLIQMDSQDLSQLIATTTDENLAWNWATNSLMAYNAHKAAGKTEEFDNEPKEETVPEDEETEDMSIAAISKQLFRGVTGKSRPQSATVSFPSGGLLGYLKKDDDQFSQYKSAAPSQTDMWNELKITALLDALVNAADAKRTRTESLPSVGSADSHVQIDTEESPVALVSLEDQPVESGSTESSALLAALEDQPAKAETRVRNVIIQVRDYNEMMKTKEGPKLLSQLRSSVDKKWRERTRIIMVGTTTTNEDAEPVKTKSDMQYLQSDIADGEKRTIYVPASANLEKLLEEDEKARIYRINIRHIQDMISKLGDGHVPRYAMDVEKDFDKAASAEFGLEDRVLNYPRVHRIAITTLGAVDDASITGSHFKWALQLLHDADAAKVKMLEQQKQDEEDSAETARYSGNDGEKKKAQEKLKELKKKCNTYEKKLLSGVVFPSDIRTTFADIRAPTEVTEALKTLTSLSLLRPSAFSYGVLSTDKIPGVLLYGPPGTGKTLLAKAVAKESGATVLEITAADLNDMFVGQGEKNVRAVFTLAKKLSPCVVFLDEADAIFAARGPRSRNAHREMINQFLREWDGMTTDLSAFIMLATNRPFDLDEAVLRRLPRRLLLDLPVEKDREAILQMHLKDEILDSSISLAKLAKDTPYYSGSDLKNVSVAAALACVREENAAAAAHTGDEAYVYPEKRTLTSKHFEKALEEISASISEDMSTLTSIRKFDEKYGDRKGRKKKGPGLGFGGTRELEKDSEAAMVRKKLEA